MIFGVAAVASITVRNHDVELCVAEKSVHLMLNEFVKE